MKYCSLRTSLAPTSFQPTSYGRRKADDETSAKKGKRKKMRKRGEGEKEKERACHVGCTKLKYSAIKELVVVLTRDCFVSPFGSLP